jgi:hypothetical protein
MIVDQDTNCTFVVDVEGYKYLLPPNVTVPDVPSITVSGLIVTISGIDIFNEVTVSGIQAYVTVSGIVVDNEVVVSGIIIEAPDVHVTVSGGSENFEYEEIYIQGYNTANFPNTNDYYPIPNMSYIVQAGEVLHITSLTAVETAAGLSTLAFYVNGLREREIPLYQDIHVVFPKPHRYYEGESLQLRIKPSNKRTTVQAFIDGYITEE